MTTTTTTTLPCPHCERPHDVSTRLHGDRVWCLGCRKWFVVVMRTNGTVYLVKCETPLDAR